MFVDDVSIDFGNLDRHRVECIYEVTEKYNLYPPFVLAVAEIEGGRSDSKVPNSNGTYDIGYMQFNTSYISKDLAKFGIKEQDLSNESCYSFDLASWRIANHIINDSGTVYQRIANYHSRTPKFNKKYQDKLIPLVKKWSVWHQKNLVLYNADERDVKPKFSFDVEDIMSSSSSTSAVYIDVDQAINTPPQNEEEAFWRIVNSPMVLKRSR